MRLKYFHLINILLLFISLFSFLSAKTVDSTTSKTVAKNYFALKGQAIIPDKEFDVVIENMLNQNITYYIFGFNDGGFVIVPGDDSVIPILGYSVDSKFEENNIPPALQDLLNHYSEQIGFVIESKIEHTENQQLWNNLINYDSKSSSNNDINLIYQSTADVNPLITTKWNQGCYYNALCPADGGGQCGHVWTGCVATAMAQIMKYWNHPITGNGSHNYNHPTYGTLSANFSTTTYNWSSMPNSISSSNNAIAILMYHCGVSMEMDYGVASSSSAGILAAAALKKYFKYSNSTTIKYNSDFGPYADYTSYNEWKNLMHNELNNLRPILMGGGTHSFVIDGDSGDYFHINWGWSGLYDGYFTLNDLTPGNSDYTLYQDAVIGIKPASEDTTPPSVPSGLSATAGDRYVSISWNANTEPDMKNYHIFRRTSPSGQEIYIASPPKILTTYTDNSVTNGTTYYYQICAVDQSNNRSKLCDMVSATPNPPLDITPPATPTITSTSVFQGGVKLEWMQNTEPDLANYYIYRSTINGFIPSLSKPMITSNKIATVDKSLTEYNDIVGVESHQVYYYKISAVDNSNNESGYSNQATVTTLNILNDNLPLEYTLSQNTPNPFNPITEIEFWIPNDENVIIVIYDLMGNEIKTLVDEYKIVGQHKVNWDGNDNSGHSVSGGIYFYQIQAGDFIQTRKMVLLK